MGERPRRRPPPERDEMARTVEEKAARKIRARRERDSSIWFGLGAFGVVGWSVAVPLLLGIALGLWLDSVLPAPFSWTLTFLFVGLAIGLLNAWYWVSREQKAIERRKGEPRRE